jgi:hypothetical protein
MDKITTVDIPYTGNSDPQNWYPGYSYYPCYYPYNDGFKDWLRGYLEGKKKLSAKELEVIKEKLNV